MGETFESVAIRELKEETGLITTKENLELITIVSGESRKNSYPNGDIVYNNTVLYRTKKYSGTLNCDYEELTDNNHELISKREAKQLRFFSLEELPENRMDKDLIETYKEFIQK